MTHLDDILLRYSHLAAGAGTSAPVRTELTAALKLHANLQSRLYMTQFLTVCVILVVVAVALASDLITATATRYVIAGGAGVSIPLLLQNMADVSREWSEADLMVILIQHADEPRIQSIIDSKLAARTRTSQAQLQGG